MHTHIADGFEHSWRSELREAINKAIRKLESQCPSAANVSWLCLVNELTERETAEAMGLSRDQVAREKRRARKVLGAELLHFKPEI